MKAVRRAEPLASPIKSNLLKVMLFIIISPYLFNEVTTAPFRMVVVTLLLSDLIVRNVERSHYRISLQ